jgi:hypothetical protein
VVLLLFMALARHKQYRGRQGLDFTQQQRDLIWACYATVAALFCAWLILTLVLIVL